MKKIGLLLTVLYGAIALFSRGEKMFRDTFGDIFIEKEVKKNVADR